MYVISGMQPSTDKIVCYIKEKLMKLVLCIKWFSPLDIIMYISGTTYLSIAFDKYRISLLHADIVKLSVLITG